MFLLSFAYRLKFPIPSSGISQKLNHYTSIVIECTIVMRYGNGRIQFNNDGN